MLANVSHRRMYATDRGFDVRPYFRAIATLEHRYLCFLNSFSRILESDWLAKLHFWASAKGVGVVGATASSESVSTTSAERVRLLRGIGLGARFRCGVAARYFPPFPNYHVRTNVFMASREILARVRVGPMLLKLSAYVFESGYESLTNQIVRLGLRPLVVGRDGVAYEKERWHLADTFRQANQQNLLVADNQTDLYVAASAAYRAELSRRAWGENARPA